MNDLISREEVIEEIQLIEKELLQDKKDAFYSDDEQMIFAIDNQLNALWRVKSRAREQPTAYDVDKVIERLEEMSGIQFDGQNESYQLDWCICTNKAIDIVKGGGQG